MHVSRLYVHVVDVTFRFHHFDYGFYGAAYWFPCAGGFQGKLNFWFCVPGIILG